MKDNLRTSAETFDAGGGTTAGNSIVEQTTDIISRFRNSLIRNRKERLIDDDVQATENIVDQLHLTELMAKETLGKLIMQGNSMQRSYRLINQLQREIKDIAEDLNEVNGGQCFGACGNGTCFGFGCFGCFNKSKKKKKKSQKRLYEKNLLKMNNDTKIIEQKLDPLDRMRWVNKLSNDSFKI